MKSYELRRMIPGYTCPDLDVVRDWLEAHHAPDEVIDALERTRIANTQLRGAATDAVRAVKRMEKVVAGTRSR